MMKKHKKVQIMKNMTDRSNKLITIKKRNSMRV